MALLMGALVSTGSAASAGSVEVAFVQPQRYADALDSNLDATANLLALAQYLEGLGRKYLPPDQTLRVDVLDVDLAGKLQPTRRWGLVRVVGGRLDWPRMVVRYRLEEHGQVVASGEEALTDMGYDLRLGSLPGHESLEADKRMLRDWFRSHFVKE
jgi:hypothetical protein